MIRSFECSECDAEFTIKHKLDDSYYQVNYCPFCGGQIDEEFLDEEED
jgi:DNA-directed RNA polymerase subunit RPC12/RpoP